MLLADYGLPEIVAVKKGATDAVARGVAPGSFTIAADRFARSAVRIALRQAAQLAECSGDAALLLNIGAWRYDGEAGSSDDADDDAPGH